MLATGVFVGVGLFGLGMSDFANEGISRGEQVLRQLGAIGVGWAWAFVTTLVILFALKFTIGLRVKEEDEERGLDLSQHGEQAYQS
jgi:Amt family ammonium transporter